jgi:hypothetical protein
MTSRLALTLLSLFCAATGLSAQQTTPAPAAPSDIQQEKKIEKKEQSKRMLGLPQFTVTDRKNAPPLKPRDKFHLFYTTSFDPAEFVLVGIESGISQADNSFPGYGQGAAGYGKRYGAAFTDQVSSGFFSIFAYPALLREDPRYFRLGHGSTAHRFGYALAKIVVGHKDDGRQTFNWSNVMGALSSGGLSNAYYPQADRGLGLTMDRAGVSLLYGGLGNLASEFWPDINKRLFRHHPKDTSLPAGEQPQK